MGRDKGQLRAIATQACDRLSLNLYELPASALPNDRQQLTTMIALREREHRLSPMALLICDDSAAAEKRVITTLINALNIPLIVTHGGLPQQYSRPVISLVAARPISIEQRGLWKAGLGNQAEEWTSTLDALVSQFYFDASTISAICSQSHGVGVEEATPAERLNIFQQLCRQHVRANVGEAAQRIERQITLDSLVLSAQTQETIKEIIANVRGRSYISENSELAPKLGMSALFVGESGTGKTTAASAIAHDTNRDIYQIHLSSAVGHCHQTTEKNLRRIFEAVDGSGAILIFEGAEFILANRREAPRSTDR